MKKAKIEVDEWISIDDKSRPMPSSSKIEIKFESGVIIDYDKDDWPLDIVTHWRHKKQV